MFIILPYFQVPFDLESSNSQRIGPKESAPSVLLPCSEVLLNTIKYKLQLKQRRKKCNNNEQYSRIFAYTTIPPSEAHVHDYLAPVL